MTTNKKISLIFSALLLATLFWAFHPKSSSALLYPQAIANAKTNADLNWLGGPTTLQNSYCGYWKSQLGYYPVDVAGVYPDEVGYDGTNIRFSLKAQSGLCQGSTFPAPTAQGTILDDAYTTSSRSPGTEILKCAWGTQMNFTSSDLQWSQASPYAFHILRRPNQNPPPGVDDRYICPYPGLKPGDVVHVWWDERSYNVDPSECNDTFPPCHSQQEMDITIPQALACSPASQTVNVGQLASFSASGGTSPYRWAAAGGSPNSGGGNSFSTTYAAAGTYNVEITDANGQLTNSPCQVTVQNPPPNSGKKPYLKTFGADVFTGGWFNQGSAVCSVGSTDYQDPNNGGNQNRGGILGFAKEVGGNAAGGGSSQYGVFSLGRVDGSIPSGSDSFGFYSSGVTPGGSVKALTFANSVGAAWGGLFEGSTPQSHCIPDYFDTQQDAGILTKDSTLNSLNDLSSLGQNGQYKQYLYNPPSGTLSIKSLAAVSKNVTLFVNGNVALDSDIDYASHSESNVPKLAIVALGSIYINGGVHHLEGLYIAQPEGGGSAVTADTGDIWTCAVDPNSTALSVIHSGTWIHDNCASRLTLNGALIAKQLNAWRITGDVATATTADDDLNTALNPANGNMSELFNYTPDMVVGGPYFKGESNSLKVDSIVSLPPVF